MSNVFEISDMLPSIDIKKVENETAKYLKNRRKLNIESEYSQHFITRASSGINISSGSEPMDVKTNNNEGIDVCCLSILGSQSNEKSVIQNFKNSGNNLDKLFSENNDKKAVELYKTDFINKLDCAKTKYSMINLYYIAFISTENKVYILCLKINIDSIINVSSSGFTKTKNSININGFIDNIYGNTRLYKAKKRIELRFTDKILSHPKIIEIYSKNKIISNEKICYFNEKYNLSELKKEMEKEGITIDELML
jgi:hypothetical protein